MSQQLSEQVKLNIVYLLLQDGTGGNEADNFLMDGTAKTAGQAIAAEAITAYLMRMQDLSAQNATKAYLEFVTCCKFRNAALEKN